MSVECAWWPLKENCQSHHKLSSQGVFFKYAFKNLGAVPALIYKKMIASKDAFHFSSTG